MGEAIGKTEGAENTWENFTLPSFADFKADVDASLNGDPDFERYLFGGKQSTFTMSNWLRGRRWRPWQYSNWSTVMNQEASKMDQEELKLKELAAMYRSRKTSWMRERQARWQARLKERYIAAWYLERMLPRHEALWAAAQVCPCRSELDLRCPAGSNCYGQRLAAGYYYDKDGNTKIRTCYTVPGATFQSEVHQSNEKRRYNRRSSESEGFISRATRKKSYNRRYDGVVEAEEEREELSCTDRTTHADFLTAMKIVLANIRDDKDDLVSGTTMKSPRFSLCNVVPRISLCGVSKQQRASTADPFAIRRSPDAASQAAATFPATNWDWRH